MGYLTLRKKREMGLSLIAAGRSFMGASVCSAAPAWEA